LLKSKRNLIELLSWKLRDKKQTKQNKSMNAKRSRHEHRHKHTNKLKIGNKRINATTKYLKIAKLLHFFRILSNKHNFF